MSLAEIKNISDQIDSKHGIERVYLPVPVEAISVLPEIKFLSRKIENYENKIAELNSAFRNLFKYSPVGFCKVSTDGWFLEVNDAWCQLVKRTREELLTLRWQDITMPRFIKADEEEVLKLIENRNDETYTMYKEYFYYQDNLKIPIPLQLTVSCVYDKYSNLLYFISQAIDIEKVHKQYLAKKGCTCGQL